MKYIQNTYRADLQINMTVDNRAKVFVFARYVQDKLTGGVASDGFTEVSDEDYKLLEKNGAFKLLVEKGKLKVTDKAPLKAGSFEQMLALKEENEALKEENEALKTAFASLKAEYEKLKGANPDAAPASDDGLDKLKLDELKAKAKELGLDAEALKKKDEVIKLIREADSTKAGE